jgi:hypothetical protein
MMVAAAALANAGVTVAGWSVSLAFLTFVMAGVVARAPAGTVTVAAFQGKG